jgi:beta-lactamase regulating signal transducer with metallopeptidase domain
MTAWSLTWLWQGGAVTLAVLATFHALPRLNGATRYAIWWSALGAIGALGLRTVATGVEAGALTVSAAARTGAEAGAIDAPLLFVPSAPGAFIAVLFGVWTAIAIVRFVRVLAGIHAVHTMRNRCRAFPSDVEAQLPLWLEVRGQGRATRLMVCDGVPGASVLGFFNPYIAVPSAMFAGLTRDELDQVILHEHAHVQRWDDWLRLAQEVLRSMLWIHPAALFIARQMDLEREIACDDSVVARTGLPKVYARCLTQAAEVRARCASALSSTAYLNASPALFQRKRDLLRRVERLLAVKGRTRRKMSTLTAVIGTCALLALTMQLHAVPLVEEIGEIVLPIVGRPEALVADFPVRPSAVARLNPASVGVTGRGPLESGTPGITDLPVRLFAVARVNPASFGETPVALGAHVAPNEDTPTIVSRPVEAQYAIAAATRPTRTTSPWHKASAAGVRFAEGLTRAGASVARRF